jgi:hypothetical protein
MVPGCATVRWVIIFSRWGFLVLLAMGAGVLFALGLNRLIAPDVRSGPGFGVFIGVGWLVAAALTWVLVRFVVRPHLDKPRPLFVLHPLPQPIVTDRGKQTHRQVPAIDPETGKQIYTQPKSTFFFIPLSVWPIILGVLGAGILVVCQILLAVK